MKTKEILYAVKVDYDLLKKVLFCFISGKKLLITIVKPCKKQ